VRQHFVPHFPFVLRVWIICLSLLMAAPASAAPTCQDKDGNTTRCGLPNSMPVGWKPSPQHLWDLQFAHPVSQNIKGLLEVLGGIALLFALIALMPKFDGSRPEDWDRQEDDDDRA
jgi:hypothetical protein